MKKYIVAVLGAGMFWGFTGLFTRKLTECGISSSGAIIARCGIAAICFGLLILFTNPRQFRIRLKDSWCFLGTGLFSLLFFTFCYFNAVQLMSLSVAAILLYTAPTIVTVLSILLFKEKITSRKIVSVAMAFVGCCLVSGITGDISVSLKGILFGLGSGLGYALYTIFSRYAIQRNYSSNTINFYSCLLATLGSRVIWGDGGLFGAVASKPTAIPWCLALGVLSCFAPYLLYTYSLTGLENTRASVLASVEPVVATLSGIVFYHEPMTVPMAIGILLVLAAVVVMHMKHRRKA